jgi:phage shock protein PspC (stress-responsive transcriptional regulator)
MPVRKWVLSWRLHLAYETVYSRYMATYKRLYRSREDRIVAGVFGGLGEYFDIDPVLLRLVFIVIFVVTGFIPGVLIYLLVIFIMPAAPMSHRSSDTGDGPTAAGTRVHEVDPDEPKGTEAAAEQPEPSDREERGEAEGYAERPMPRSEPVASARREDPLW